MKCKLCKTDKKELTLVVVSDIHLGHINCDKEILKNVIEWIKTHDCIWIGLGDYGDCIIHTDPRFNHDSIDKNFDTAQKQFREIKRYFKPIASKCIGLLDGNHDYNLMKKADHNYVEELAEDLNVDYLTMDAYIRIQFTKFDNFNIYAHHGWSGARTAGARVSRIYDLYSIFPMLDLYIMGHTHALGLVEKKTSLYIDGWIKEGQNEKDIIHDKISHFLWSGSFLKGYTMGTMGYVEEKTYQPSTLGSPILKIIPHKGKYTVNFQIEYSEVR